MLVGLITDSIGIMLVDYLKNLPTVIGEPPPGADPQYLAPPIHDDKNNYP